MRRRRGPNKTHTKSKYVEKNKDNEEEEVEDSVEAIVNYKVTNKTGAGGYLLHIKWLGYSEQENTWEPMKDILDGWDCENKDIYKFFEKEGIDVSGCSDFDFEKRKKKTMDKDKEASIKKCTRKGRVQMDNYNAKTTTEEGKRNISTVVISAKQNQVEGYICDLSHKPSDLNMEDDGRNATHSFLKDQLCNLCNKMFVEKNEEKKKDLYVVSQRSPCYTCCDMNCTYFLCGECYRRELVSSSNSGRSSRRNNCTK